MIHGKKVLHLPKLPKWNAINKKTSSKIHTCFVWNPKNRHGIDTKSEVRTRSSFCTNVNILTSFFIYFSFNLFFFFFFPSNSSSSRTRLSTTKTTTTKLTTCCIGICWPQSLLQLGLFLYLCPFYLEMDNNIINFYISEFGSWQNQATCQSFFFLCMFLYFTNSYVLSLFILGLR